MALPLHNCSSCSKPSADFCFTCDRQLCEQHASKADHECPTVSRLLDDAVNNREFVERLRKGKLQEGDAYNDAHMKTSNNNFSALLSSIDRSHILNNAIKIGKYGSATIKDCHLDIPASRDTALMGGKHLHLPLNFKNGDKWLVRVALQGGTASPQELLIQEMSSEVATLTALESVGVRIAKAKSRCIVPRGVRHPYFFLEWLNGKASFMDAELLQKKAWVNEIAKDFIRLEKLSFNAIGCLAFESEDRADLCVGPMVEPALCGRNKQGHLSQFGSFENAQDFRVTQVQQVLAQIEGGFKYSDNAVDAYLIHLEIIDLIKVLYPTSRGPHLFYIRHADDKGDHWLFHGDSFLGTIDWEWAYTTTKEEAFSSPLAFVDIRAFYDGHNGLSELEDTFAAAFDSLERPDLATLVRGGKIYQRIPFVIGVDFLDLPNLFLAFRQLVLGKESRPNFEEWRKEAWENYKGHQFLALKMIT